MPSGLEDRAYWINVAERLAQPVLSALSEGRLKSTMPVEARNSDDRHHYTHLEALGRLLTGIAPWLELQDNGDEAEARKRAHWRQMAQAALAQAVNPQSPDFLNFSRGGQPLVDAAFLAHAMLRAPQTLWHQLDGTTQANLVAALKATRTIRPVWNNWLLFSAMVEAALALMGEEPDKMRLDYALRQHEQWYLGDGAYGDGPQFHWDYYNSFVIQPFLVNILAQVAHVDTSWQALQEPMLRRAQRYAAVQERFISPEGTIPPIGRSLAYRCGALHSLAHAALIENLPAEVTPAGVRCAITAVTRRLLEAPGTFDEAGWLRIGWCGAQPDIGETYISTGSLYLCSVALLPLGLPSSHPFWSEPAAPWTSQKLYSGHNLPVDHAL